MVGLVEDTESNKKKHLLNKKDDREPTAKKARTTLAARKIDETPINDIVTEIGRLEEEIRKSQKHYNNIATILELIKKNNAKYKTKDAAISCLCRVFCRLLAEGRLGLSEPKVEKNERVIREWLKSKFEEYKEILMLQLEDPDPTHSFKALSICMALVKEEIVGAKSKNLPSNVESVWKNGTFGTMFDMLLWTTGNDMTCQAFAKNFAHQYDDVRHFTFIIIAETLRRREVSRNNTLAVKNALTILSNFDFIPQPEVSNKLTNSFCQQALPQNELKPITYNDHRKQAQKAWLAVISCGLSKAQRKHVLNIMSDDIVPWFANVELLMDFLTDSYNLGGATSLLSLSGLFHLIQVKNLDYPAFYPKLYSLLDADLLHSKHRSRFFRLMNTFMSSTHLPVAMVASFIKRLSRLALHAPPGGIVAVVPWIYNMLKAHPITTFMIHREPHTPEEKADIEKHGFRDPFKMEESDPMLTDALESSLWELVTLQAHYHPNVASLARIVSEQFTKREYNIEDFLDHSYASLIEAELGKELKKTPVVEYEIPRKIFTEVDGDNTLGTLIGHVLEADPVDVKL